MEALGRTCREALDAALSFGATLWGLLTHPFILGVVLTVGGYSLLAQQGQIDRLCADIGMVFEFGPNMDGAMSFDQTVVFIERSPSLREAADECGLQAW